MLSDRFSGKKAAVKLQVKPMTKIDVTIIQKFNGKLAIWYRYYCFLAL